MLDDIVARLHNAFDERACIAQRICKRLGSLFDTSCCIKLEKYTENNYNST